MTRRRPTITCQAGVVAKTILGVLLLSWAVQLSRPCQIGAGRMVCSVQYHNILEYRQGHCLASSLLFAIMSHLVTFSRALKFRVG